MKNICYDQRNVELEVGNVNRVFSFQRAIMFVPNEMFLS